MKPLPLRIFYLKYLQSMIFRCSGNFRKISNKNILCGVILIKNRCFEQSVCKFSKRETLLPVFSGEIFENEWIWTAASEHFEIAPCNVIRFLTVKIYLVFFDNVTLNVNIEILKTNTLELSIE